MPFVSVVIPVYNDPEGLARCLSALDEQTYRQEDYEVIAVDNGSDAPIDPVTKRFRQARAAYEQKGGSYAARNRGIALARGDVIAFTDADCIPAPEWIERGVKQLQKMPAGAGVAGGRIDFFFQQDDQPNAVEVVDSSLYLDQERYCKELNFSVTANLFVQGAVLKDVGLFEDRLTSSGDNEWSRRATDRGYEIAYAEDASVAHPARASLAGYCKKIRRITRGRYNKKKLRGDAAAALLRDVLGSVWFRLKRTMPRLATNQYRSQRDRWKVIVVFLIAEGVVRLHEGLTCWVRDQMLDRK